MSANEVSVVDIVPQADSGEANDNSEPSIAVNPANPLQLVAASFGPPSHSPFFVSTDGGTTWSNFGVLIDSDKTIAWSPDGSAVLTATLVSPDEPLPVGADADEGGADFQLNTYSASQSELVTSSGNFGAPINNFIGSNQNDQPWLRTSPDGQVYMAYSNLGVADTTHQTASVNVSTDGGFSYPEIISLDRIGGNAGGDVGQDDPAIRLAVSGTTTYAVFDRWNTRIEDDAYGERHDAQLVVDKSLIGGADDFTAAGAGGNGVQVGPDHINVFTRSADTQLSVGLNRIAGGDIAIAVDPNNANHVVVAYTDGPGFDGAGAVQLIVAESEDGGTTWSQKYTTSETTRASQPGLAILDDGTIGFLYVAYDPGTNELSQHLVTTSNDFASTNDITLATETNNAFATFTENPYLGDFFDLSGLGDTFYGIFSALNLDNGDPTSGAAFTNVTFQRDVTGTPGTSTFQLTNSGRAVSESVDPFAFTLSGAGTTTQSVSAGVVSSAVSVTSANILEILSGGTASATSVNSSGTEQIDLGGTANRTVISSGGIEVVYGRESGAALVGGTLEVLSGGSVSGATVSSGGTLEIWSSGTAISTTVLSGGTLEYFGGAIASGTTLSAGATLEAGSGYLASGLAISSGLTLAVGAEGSAVNNTVLGGGALSVLFGGTASGTVVSSGGVESISFVGSALGTEIGSGGSQDVASGGFASGTRVDAGGSEVVGPFASAVDATVSRGGSLIVSSGGALELIGDDTLSGVTLLPGAILVIGSGYTLSGYVVASGITLGALSGGTASNTTILSGGAFEFFGGGNNVGSTFNSGAITIVGRNEKLSGLTVNASSPLEIALGGEADGAIVVGGGIESVLAGGVDAGSVVRSGGTEIVYSGGTINDGRVAGDLIVSAGTAIDITVDGSESVLSGGVDTASTIDVGGSVVVASGGLVMRDALFGVLSLSGGLAVSTTMENGALENVFSGGLDSAAKVSSGAIEFVFSGGATRSATIDNGGLFGLFGGTANWTTISSGGTVSVFSGGLDSAALISVGGAEVVASGGIVSGATLSGGVLTLSFGGAATSTRIGNTAEEVVTSGGTIGFTTIDGGTLTLHSGALISGGVVFASGGILRISDTAVPSNLVVSGFAAGDVIDLAAAPFSSNGTASTSGNVLTVSVGGQTYNISFSTTLPGSNFALLPDDGSGTDVVSGVAISSGQTISITSGQMSTGLAVLSGGAVDVLSGCSASATILANGGLAQVSSGGTAVGTRIMSSGTLTNSGGTTISITVGNGGTETVSAGGIDSVTIINPGGNATISAGGVMSGAIINSGGTLDVRGGSAISTTIALGGREDIHFSGLESGAIIGWGGNDGRFRRHD